MSMVPAAPDSDPEEERPVIETAADLRPILSDLGIEEIERGVCQDTFENRRILRAAKLNWMPVYARNGAPTGLIMARSLEMEKERRLLSISERRPILVEPNHNNSDYLTGLDLLAEPATDYLVPPWVLGATRAWLKEQENGGPSSPRRQPLSLPTRCRHIKEDGLRCLLWSSGRPKDDGLCRIHLSSTKRRPGEDVERARAKLTQAAPYAVDVLEDLMANATSEPVKLKASTEILDRAGVRGGIEFDARLEVSDSRAPADIVAERLQRLAGGAVELAARLAGAGTRVPSDVDIEDAEVVDDQRSEEQPS